MCGLGARNSLREQLNHMAEKTWMKPWLGSFILSHLLFETIFEIKYLIS